eukprot:3844241-Prymnesium_polylepis.1
MAMPTVKRPPKQDHASAMSVSSAPGMIAQCQRTFDSMLDKVFTSHVRTEANFVRDNDDKELVLPPAYHVSETVRL